jgi:hypothetical protein
MKPSAVESPRCPCGWTIEGLKANMAEHQTIIERYTTGDCNLHPFRVAGIAGASKAIATLQWHMAGGCESKSRKRGPS